MVLDPLIPAWMYAVALLVAAVGLVALIWSLYGDRARGQPRCPKCWYSLPDAILPGTCSECGHAINSSADLHKIRRRKGWAILAFVLVAVPFTIPLLNAYARPIYYAVMPRWELISEERIERTTVRRYKIRDPRTFGGRAVVLNDGNVMLDLVNESAYLQEASPSSAITDTNNDGIPEVFLQGYRPNGPNRIVVVEIRAGSPVIAADVDGDKGRVISFHGESVFDIADQWFDGWKGGRGLEVGPDVYYRLESGRLTLALDATETISDSPSARRRLKQAEARLAGRIELTPLLWGTMLSLFYTNREDEAWQLFDHYWRGDSPSKEAFRAEFRQRLAADPWYQDVLAARAARAAGRPIPAATIDAGYKAP